MRKNNGRSVGDLIVIELAKVLHIHFYLVNVGNGGKAVKHRTVLLCSLCRLDNVGKLTYSGGLDDDSVGSVFLENLDESL